MLHVYIIFRIQIRISNHQPENQYNLPVKSYCEVKTCYTFDEQRRV